MYTILAPMAGYTDRAVRDVCRSYGANLVYGEMINAHTVVRTPQKAKELLGIDGEPSPIAVQLFGSDPVMLADAASMLEAWRVDYIDFNAGCPVKKVVSIGAGAALLKDIPLLTECVRSIKNAVTRAKVSLKIRAGWDRSSLVLQEIGSMVSDVGLEHITLHARTRADGFSGDPCLQYIRELKKTTTIPVIGNGNVLTWNDAYTMIRETGCDGVMIGRGAIGRPWIFEEINQHKDITKTHDEIRAMVVALYKEKSARLGEHTAVVEMRKTVPFFIRGWKHAKQIRMQLNYVHTLKEVEEALCGL